jgi:hypothetical protein
VRIPLDYYRILGLPTQATADQLQQAYRDRTLQLPRREYSEAAIVARKELIDEAYGVLSDANQRQTYDAAFLKESYIPDTDLQASLSGESTNGGVDPYTPSIEVQDRQFVGALLLLLELGEYELVLRLGRPFLTSGNLNLDLQDGRYGEPEIVLADIVLTLALACLELGREQWQQGQYENAAESLETGQELLLREGLFPALRGEMQADLLKLRPYRVLELLSLTNGSDYESFDRQKGLSILQDMIDERGGIDGTGDDQSGLSVDDFLRFVQQLRSYLTTAEQQEIFEAEAGRPSAVATYLAVYALIARGFAERQPALIRRAKLMLVRLGIRQDVYLEQALCALLLGQTEEANRALEMSQEYDSLAFIREHSKESPDLLPGLCLYGERWLQNEVFPHFRDLATQHASLKDYFADDQVQAYLEELPNEPEVTPWATAVGAASRTPWTTASATTSTREQRLGDRPEGASYGAIASGTATATLDSEPNSMTTSGVTTMPAAERVSQTANAGSPGYATAARGTRTSSSTPRRAAGPTGSSSGTRSPSLSARRAAGRPSPRLDRLALVIAVGILGLMGTGLVISKIVQALAGSGSSPETPTAPTAAPAVAPAANSAQVQSTPLSDMAEAIALQVPSQAPAGDLTETTAKQVVETWLAAKSRAMGSQHQTDQLSAILVEPVLSRWQQQATQADQGGWHVEYEHNVTVESAMVDEVTPDQGTVEASVRERAQVYENGTLNSEASYDDTIRVRYDLVQEDGQWRIQGMTVL